MDGRRAQELQRADHRGQGSDGDLNAASYFNDEKTPRHLARGGFFLMANLFRQQITLARYVAIKFEIGADDDWLVRSYSHGESNVSIGGRISRRVGHDPLNVARVRWVKRNRRDAGFTWVSCRRTRARNRVAREIVSISVENVDCDVRNARAAVENINIVARAAAGAGPVRGRANPNVRWATA